MRAVRAVVGFVLALIGLPGIPEDVQRWRVWLDAVLTYLNRFTFTDMVFLVTGIALLLSAIPYTSMRNRIVDGDLASKRTARDELNAEWQKAQESFFQELRTKAAINRMVLTGQTTPAQPQHQPRHVYTVVNPTGGIQSWLRLQVDILAPMERDRLFSQHPGMREWYES